MSFNVENYWLQTIISNEKNDVRVLFIYLIFLELMQWMSEELSLAKISQEQMSAAIQKSANQNGLKLEQKQLEILSTYSLSSLQKANLQKVTSGTTSTGAVPFQKPAKKTLVSPSHSDTVLIEHMVQEDPVAVQSSTWKAKYATWKRNIRLFRSGWLILVSWILLNLALFFVGFFCNFFLSFHSRQIIKTNKKYSIFLVSVFHLQKVFLLLCT